MCSANTFRTVHYLLVPAVIISDRQHPQRSALCDISVELKIMCTLMKEMCGKSKVHGGLFLKKFPELLHFFFHCKIFPPMY